MMKNILLFGPAVKNLNALLTGRITYRLTDVSKTDKEMSQLGLRIKHNRIGLSFAKANANRQFTKSRVTRVV